MAKLYYWVSECHSSDDFSVVGKTRKEVIKKLKQDGNLGSPDYATCVRKVIDYKDAFDLFEWSTALGRTNAGVKVSKK